MATIPTRETTLSIARTLRSERKAGSSIQKSRAMRIRAPMTPASPRAKTRTRRCRAEWIDARGITAILVSLLAQFRYQIYLCGSNGTSTARQPEDHETQERHSYCPGEDSRRHYKWR